MQKYLAQKWRFGIKTFLINAKKYNNIWFKEKKPITLSLNQIGSPSNEKSCHSNGISSTPALKKTREKIIFRHWPQILLLLSPLFPIGLFSSDTFFTRITGIFLHGASAP
jgi:hypothetical protein